MELEKKKAIFLYNVFLTLIPTNTTLGMYHKESNFSKVGFCSCVVRSVEVRPSPSQTPQAQADVPDETVRSLHSEVVQEYIMQC